jgi:hypothetical protein
MTKRLHTSDRTSMQVVEGWLNALGGMPPQQCPTCGSTMTDISVAFFLLGGDKSWTTLIPICSSCELEVGRTSRLPRPGFGTGVAYSLQRSRSTTLHKESDCEDDDYHHYHELNYRSQCHWSPLLLPRFYTCMRCHAPSSEFLRKI